MTTEALPPCDAQKAPVVDPSARTPARASSQFFEAAPGRLPGTSTITATTGLTPDRHPITPVPRRTWFPLRCNQGIGRPVRGRLPGCPLPGQARLGRLSGRDEEEAQSGALRTRGLDMAGRLHEWGHPLRGTRR